VHNEHIQKLYDTNYRKKTLNEQPLPQEESAYLFFFRTMACSSYCRKIFLIRILLISTKIFRSFANIQEHIII